MRFMEGLHQARAEEIRRFEILALIFTSCARSIRPCILCYNIRLCIRHNILPDEDSYNKDMDLHNRKRSNQPEEEPPEPLPPLRS